MEQTAEQQGQATPLPTYEELRGGIESGQATFKNDAERTTALTRLLVGETLGLPASLAVRLRGEDITAMRADGEALKAELATLRREMEAEWREAHPQDDRKFDSRKVTKYHVPGKGR